MIYKVYTDGSCVNNPGVGGWAAVIIYPDGVKRELSGHTGETTNNRMEILAAIKAISSLPEGSVVEVYSDSLLVINVMNGIWRRNKNTELWKQLDKVITNKKVTWQWIKGHAGHPEQERADKLAKKAARGL